MSNNNNNNNSEKKNWKMYASLALYAILGLALGYSAFKGYVYMSHKMKMVKKENVEIVSNMNTNFTGEVSHNFEGENKAMISFDHDKSFTVTQGTENKAKYFYIANASGTNIATLYVSYEGGRGFTAEDYIGEVLAKAIPTISNEGVNAYASSSWNRASSANSVWNIKGSENGSWLLVLENTKANTQNVSAILETLTIK